MSTGLVDIGVNLTHASFAPDLDEVIADARAADVATMIVTGTSLEESRHALDLCAEQDADLHPTAGIHPHHAGELHDGDWEALEALMNDPAVCAIGETGLDFYRNFAPHDAQQRVFERHIEIAIRLGKPMFLHERDAHDTFFDILRSHRDRLPDVVVHCFTGDRRALHNYLDLDCHIGITGWVCDERRGTDLAQLTRDIPAGRLMIETDAPYLLPRNLRPRPQSRRNEPRHLAHVATFIAARRGESYAALAAHTTQTARRFFGLPTHADSGASP